MWTCPRCGERHEDQFKECWKCFEAQMNEQVTAAPPKAKPPEPQERKLRSTGSILLRAGIGFLAGMLLSMSSFNFINPQTSLLGLDLSSTNVVVFGLVIGLIFGTIVGLFFWVLFPYEAAGHVSEGQANDAKETHHLP